MERGGGAGVSCLFSLLLQFLFFLFFFFFFLLTMSGSLVSIVSATKSEAHLRAISLFRRAMKNVLAPCSCSG